MPVLVLRILLELGEPDNLLGIDAFPVHHGGHLPVRASGVKADAAAIQVASQRAGGLVGLGAILQGPVQDFQIPLIDLPEKVRVKGPVSVGGIVLPQPLRDLGAAAEIDPEPADGPEQELHHPLHIPEVRPGKGLGAMDPGSPNRDLPVVALHRNGNGDRRSLQIGLPPDAEGNKPRIQLGHMLQVYRNAQILHSINLPFGKKAPSRRVFGWIIS